MKKDEDARLAALDALAILDTPQEERFDRLTRLVSETLAVPIALVVLVASDRQWFKSRVGLDVTETPRSIAFCSHAVDIGDMLVVDDTTLDPRFIDNPLVTGVPFIRFYAGQPVFSADGQPVGTLCIIDNKPRQLSARQKQILRDFAALAQDELNKVALISARASAEAALHELNERLEVRVAERTRSLEQTNKTLSEEIERRHLVESQLRNGEQRIRTLIDTSLVAFISVDSEGRVVDWNPSAERTFGWMRDEVIGLDLATLIVPPEFREAHRQGMQRILSGGPSNVINKRLELPAKTRENGEIMVAMTISIFDFEGQRHFGAFLRDISEELNIKRALDEKREILSRKQELLDAVLDTVDIGVVACSADGKLSLFNRAAREFHGLPPELLDTATWAQHYSLYAADGVELLKPAEIPLVRALQGETLRDTPMVIAPADMPRRFILASGKRIASSAGTPMGAVVAMKDITAINEVQRRLSSNEQRLRDITDNIPALIGHLDQSCRITFINAPALRFYGRTGQNLVGQHLSVIYSDTEFAAIVPMLDRVFRGERVKFEDEIQVADELRYFQASLIPDRDVSGKIQGFYFMALDITARKNSEIKQRESDERLRTIADNLPVLIAYIDRQLRYQFVNELYRLWLNKNPADMLGRTVVEIFGEQFGIDRWPYVERCFAGQKTNADFTIFSGAAERLIHTEFIPHFQGGEVVGAYIFTIDVTATRRQSANLYSLANTDALTGLPNRRDYDKNLHEAVKHAQGTGASLALIYLDIDHFKQINDTLGHAAGDQVLQEFSRRLARVIRKTDKLSRFAGDEFTILVSDLPTLEMCKFLGEKILLAIRQPFQVMGKEMRISTSIGIAWCETGDCDEKTLSDCADAALYKAKDGGRDQYYAVDAVVSDPAG